MSPRYLTPGEGGGPPRLDVGADVAVVQLATSVPNIAPMPTVRPEREIARGMRATVIGYGRTVAGVREDIDDLLVRPDHRDRYPGIRKRAEMSLVSTGGLIEAAPAAGTTGGTCFADSGSALILADGALLGVLADGPGFCGERAQGFWASLREIPNATFIEARLAAARTHR